MTVYTVMSGPCIICGLTNYPLSMGGPTICPSCDCGDFGMAKVQRQAKEIERLQRELTLALAEVEELRAELDDARLMIAEWQRKADRRADRIAELEAALERKP